MSLEEGFAELVRSHRDRVFRVALSVLGPGRAAEAEDVTQEVFVRAHRALPAFRGESRLGTWLYRLAFNRAVDHRRRLGRRAEEPLSAAGTEAGSVDDGGGPPDLPDRGAGSDPYGTARRAEESQAVLRALLRLSDEQRAALHLHYWLGHTVAEIGRLLGLPAGTVKSHLHRGRERLRKELEPHGT